MIIIMITMMICLNDDLSSSSFENPLELRLTGCGDHVGRLRSRFGRREQELRARTPKENVSFSYSAGCVPGMTTLV